MIAITNSTRSQWATTGMHTWSKASSRLVLSIFSKPPVMRHKCKHWSWSPTCTVHDAIKSLASSFFDWINWTVFLLHNTWLHMNLVHFLIDVFTLSSWMSEDNILTNCSGISAPNPDAHYPCAMHKWLLCRSTCDCAILWSVQFCAPTIYWAMSPTRCSMPAWLTMCYNKKTDHIQIRIFKFYRCIHINSQK